MSQKILALPGSKDASDKWGLYPATGWNNGVGVSNAAAITPSGNLLIVDDDVYVIKSLFRLLRPFCNQIFTASNGEDALDILAHQQINTIVSDALIPPVTGIELFRKGRDALPGLRTVMLSGKTDMSDILQAQRMRIICVFIPKPWDNDAIVAAIRGSPAKVNHDASVMEEECSNALSAPYHWPACAIPTS